MTEHGVAKHSGVNRAELNSILKVVLIEQVVCDYLKAEPEALRFSLKQLCDEVDREAENIKATSEA
jgi:hypothetical protein